jgi:Fe2+ transport system protein B
MCEHHVTVNELVELVHKKHQKIGIATIYRTLKLMFESAAKEAVVSTLGVLYKVGLGADEKNMSLKESLLADKTFNPLIAFVLMLFTFIVPPCIAAMSMIRAEIGKCFGLGM